MAGYGEIGPCVVDRLVVTAVIYFDINFQEEMFYVEHFQFLIFNIIDWGRRAL